MGARNPALTTPVIDRLLAKVKTDEATGCWNFTGAKNDFGYGIIGLGGRGDGNDRTHRVAYRHFEGEIPDGLFVLHRCDNPACCNPKHLFLGTALDNTADMLKKGRGSKPPRNDHDRGSYRYNSKLTEDLVKEFRKRRDAGETGYSLWKEANKSFPICWGPFYRMLNRKSWRHV